MTAVAPVGAEAAWTQATTAVAAHALLGSVSGLYGSVAVLRENWHALSDDQRDALFDSAHSSARALVDRLSDLVRGMQDAPVTAPIHLLAVPVAVAAPAC